MGQDQNISSFKKREKKKYIIWIVIMIRDPKENIQGDEIKWSWGEGYL